MTSQGRRQAIFRRALERRNHVVAITTAREVGRLSLDELLELLKKLTVEQLVVPR